MCVIDIRRAPAGVLILVDMSNADLHLTCPKLRPCAPSWNCAPACELSFGPVSVGAHQLEQVIPVRIVQQVCIFWHAFCTSCNQTLQTKTCCEQQQNQHKLSSKRKTKMTPFLNNQKGCNCSAVHPVSLFVSIAISSDCFMPGQFLLGPFVSF